MNELDIEIAELKEEVDLLEKRIDEILEKVNLKEDARQAAGVIKILEDEFERAGMDKYDALQLMVMMASK